MHNTNVRKWGKQTNFTFNEMLTIKINNEFYFHFNTGVVAIFLYINAANNLL